MVLLPALNPACSSVIISSAWGLSLFKMTLNMTLLEMTDEADSSVVLAKLQVALFRECNTQRLTHGIGHFPVLQILVQISVKKKHQTTRMSFFGVWSMVSWSCW